MVSPSHLFDLIPAFFKYANRKADFSFSLVSKASDELGQCSLHNTIGVQKAVGDSTLCKHVHDCSQSCGVHVVPCNLNLRLSFGASHSACTVTSGSL